MGAIPVILIGIGILYIFTNPVLTVIAWIIAVTLHIGAIYYSTKREVSKTSYLVATFYGLATASYFIFCFFKFFIQLMEILKTNV